MSLRVTSDVLTGTGLTSARGASSSPSGWKTNTPLQGADLRSCEADAVRLLHQVLHPLTSRRRSSSKLSISLARIRNTGSGYWRIWRQREPPARLALGVGLLFENLALLFDVLLGHAASLWTARGSADRRRRLRSSRLSASPGPRAASSCPAARCDSARLVRLRDELALDDGREGGRSGAGPRISAPLHSVAHLLQRTGHWSPAQAR